MTAVHDLRPSPPACRDGTVLRAQINEFTPNCVSQPDPDRGTIVFQRMTDNDFDGLLGSEKAPKISEEEWVQFQFHLKEWLLLRRDAASRRTGSPPGGGSGRRGWAARPTRRRATASHWTSSSRRLRGRPQAAPSLARPRVAAPLRRQRLEARHLLPGAGRGPCCSQPGRRPVSLHVAPLRAAAARLPSGGAASAVWKLVVASGARLYPLRRRGCPTCQESRLAVQDGLRAGHGRRQPEAPRQQAVQEADDEPGDQAGGRDVSAGDGHPHLFISTCTSSSSSPTPSSHTSTSSSSSSCRRWARSSSSTCPRRSPSSSTMSSSRSRPRRYFRRWHGPPAPSRSTARCAR